MANRTGPTGRSGTFGARRLDVLAVLVISLLATLVGRLYWVQVLDPNKPAQSAGVLHDGRIVVPAPRGLIVDARGRSLIDNRETSVVTVDRDTLQQQPDHGRAVLTNLAALLGTTEPALARQITPCSPTVSAPCWTGEPYQPVPVTSGATDAQVLALSEHREEYPGIAVQTESVRDYPGGSLAAHVLGYTGAVSADDEKTDPDLHDADSIGRTGLEAEYDALLRGTDGADLVPLDGRGLPAGPATSKPAVQGDTLVTSIDANAQALVEKALADQIQRQRTVLHRPATSGAAVVMDPNTGRIVAIASYPTYNPTVFVGGISNADYASLTGPKSDDPLVGRAIAGQYAPGSTFKLITSSSIVTNNEEQLDQKYPCPGSLSIDGRVKTNYDSESFSYPLTLKQALQVSCDTFFYAFAANEYYRDQQAISSGGKATEDLQKMASAFGIGSVPGVDLPADEQASGSYADRESRMARWKANKDQYCKDAKTGFPGDPDNAYLTELAKENCTDGWRYRAGDNADMAIGQGETTLSPLQLAVAYSALVNGGTVWRPTIGWAAVDPSGKVVKQINPTVKNKLPVAQSTLNYIASSLQFTGDHTVSGAMAFDGAPYKLQLGGKTGTAEVYGQNDTSWLASWGPVTANPDGSPHAKYVVVGMIENTGTGATAAAPMLRQIYDGLLGAGGSPAVLPQPESTLPDLATLGAASARPVPSPAPSTPAGAPSTTPTGPAVPSYPPRTR